MKDLEKILEETAVKLLGLAVTRLPEDVKGALRRAYRVETSPIAKKQLSIIIENFGVAEREGLPICQDTGTINFYLSLGEGFPLKYRLIEILRRATRRATETVPLRPNAIDSFTGRNTGNNTGLYIPHIHWELARGDRLGITVMPKGGGSENTSKLYMLSPAGGVKALKKAVVDAVVEAGGKPCPPVILGLGIGGGSDIALELAKKALLRPLDQRHNNPLIAELEEDLLRLTNETGIGAMGLGGDVSVLAVNIEYAHRHPASLPLGVAFQCWAARRASALIEADGRVSFTSHKTD